MSPVSTASPWSAVVCAVAALGILLVAEGSCVLDDCALPQPCCHRCEQAAPRLACESCAADETLAFLCPARSACHVAAFIGDGPAHCCPGGCDAQVLVERPKRCEADERYLHECGLESHCFQSHRASLAGTVYVPWQEEATGTSVPLLGLWGRRAGEALEVWAVGAQGRILRRRGGLWSAMASSTSEPLYGIWGGPSGPLWAVGGNGTVLRGEGDSWERVEVPSTAHLRAVWGNVDGLWAVGDGGTVLHYDGQTWRIEDARTTARLDTLHGHAGVVWAAGVDGVVLRRGASGGWAEVPAPSGAWRGLWVSGPKEIWLAGAGGALVRGEVGDTAETSWTPAESAAGAGFGALWQAGGDLWAVGGRGLMARRRGGDHTLPLAWQLVSYYQRGQPVDLLALWGDGETLLAAGALGTVFVSSSE